MSDQNEQRTGTPDTPMAETPAERGEQIGAALEAEAAARAAEAATPAGEAQDRKAHRGIAIAAVAFAVLLIGAGIAYSVLAPAAEDDSIEVTGTDAVHSTEGPAENNSDTGDGNGGNAATTPAPDFTMTTSEGKTLHLSDFKGRPVLLNFWASWCGPCKSEMPDFQKAYETYGEEIQFMMVDLTDGSRETRETAGEFIEEQGFTFPVYYDVNQEGAYAFYVSALPATYFIDEKGRIVAVGKGMLDEEALEKGISYLISD